MSRVPPTLLRDPEFLKFWSGQSISLVGSQFTLLALPIAAAVTLRATSAEMGVLTALQFAPGLLLGLAAGVLLDRARRRPVLVATQVASATVLATVPLAAALHLLSIQQLFVVVFLAGSAAAFFGVAQVAFLPTLVGRERLVEANARYQTSRTVASLIGPGLAGAVVQLLTAPMAIAVDASSFLVGAVTTAWLRVAEPVAERARGRHVARETIAGLTWLWRQPLVRAVRGTLLIANAGGGMFAAVLVLLFVGQLGITPAQFGLVFVASSLGSLVGSLLIRPLQRRGGTRTSYGVGHRPPGSRGSHPCPGRLHVPAVDASAVSHRRTHQHGALRAAHGAQPAPHPARRVRGSDRTGGGVGPSGVIASEAIPLLAIRGQPWSPRGPPDRSRTPQRPHQLSAPGAENPIAGHVDRPTGVWPADSVAGAVGGPTEIAESALRASQEVDQPGWCRGEASRPIKGVATGLVADVQPVATTPLARAAARRTSSVPMPRRRSRG